MSTSITQLNHLRIPLDEIQKATNNFSEKNIIGKGGFGNVYKGQLLRSGELINISARRLDRSQGQGGFEFWTEVSVLSSLKHPNIVSLIGFCDEKGEKIIINRFEAKGSLCMYLSDPALTWIQRLRICRGVANAISYIHHEEVGRNYFIIHRNINSSTILLDDKFEAKLSGFEFSIKGSTDRTERFIPSEIIGTVGYMDPETLKSGDVTQKSDIYSFGVVLCELLCGRKAFLPDESEDNKFLVSLVRFHCINKTLQDIIHPAIWNLAPSDSLEMFAIVAVLCTFEDQQNRQDINPILAFFKTETSKQESRKQPHPLQDISTVEMDKTYALLLQLEKGLRAMVKSTSFGAWKVEMDKFYALLPHLETELGAMIKSMSSETWKAAMENFYALLLHLKRELGAMAKSTSSGAWKVDRDKFYALWLRLERELGDMIKSTSSGAWKVLSRQFCLM